MKVSVIIPAFEAGVLLVEAVESVARQQGFVLGEDVEIVVANDGATRHDSLDGLARVRRMRGVKVIDTPGRTGPGTARNLAAGHATGDWLSFLDADDRYAPDALRIRFEACTRNARVTCVATDYAEFQADAPFDPGVLCGVVATTPHRRSAVGAAFASGACIVLDRPLEAFVGSVPFWTGSVMIQRAVFERLGGFPSHFIAEDIHLWLRIAATEVIAFDPRVTAYCRKGHASLTAGESAMNLKTAQCFEHLAADPTVATARGLIVGQIVDAYLSESYLARKEGRTRDALACAWRAFRWAPANRAAWRALALATVVPRSIDRATATTTRDR